MEVFTNKNEFMDYVDYLKEVYGTIELHPQHDTSIFATAPDATIRALYIEERLHKKYMDLIRTWGVK